MFDEQPKDDVAKVLFAVNGKGASFLICILNWDNLVPDFRDFVEDEFNEPAVSYPMGTYTADVRIFVEPDIHGDYNDAHLVVSNDQPCTISNMDGRLL